MRILLPFLLLLLASCSGNQNSGSEETSSTKNEKEVASDTLRRIEFKHEDISISIHEVDDFDTTWQIEDLEHRKCMARNLFVYTFKNSSEFKHTSSSGMYFDTSFQGILISVPKENDSTCRNSRLDIPVEKWRQQACDLKTALPTYKGLPCPYEIKKIDGKDALLWRDTIAIKGSNYISTEIRTKDRILMVTGIWKKGNDSLGRQITDALLSFKTNL